MLDAPAVREALRSLLLGAVLLAGVATGWLLRRAVDR